MAQTLAAVLSALPPLHVATLDGAEGGGKRRAAPSLLAFSLDRSELLRYDAINGRLLVSNIARDPGQVTACAIKPGVEFAPESVVVNASGSLVALVGEHGCCVLRRTAADTQQCRPIAVGRLFFASRPGTRILKACWHPASLSHLALLCSDNCLRLYSVGHNAVDLEEPEQVLRPHLPAAAVAQSLKLVSFAFGASCYWSHFTVYFAASDNNVYCVCPFAPRHVAVPTALMQHVTQWQTHEISRLEHALKAAHSAVGDSDKMVRHTTKQLAAATRALKWLQSGMEPAADVLLQGPLGVAADAIGDAESVCDVVVIAAVFPVIVTLYASGLLELRLQLQCAPPAWASATPAAKAAEHDWVVLLDRLDVAPSLMKALGSSSMPADAPLPALHADVLQSSVWYVTHAGGVDCFALPELERVLGDLERALLDERSDGAFPPLPRATSAALLQRDMCTGAARLRGFCAMASTTAAGGEYVACVDVSGTLSCIDLMGPPTAIATVAAAAASDAAATGPAPAESPWQTEHRDWERRRPAPIPRVDLGGKTRLEQLTAFRELALAYRSHAEHLKEGKETLVDARADLVRRRERASQVAAQLAAVLTRCSERVAVFEGRLELAQRNHKNLMDRCAVIESIVAELQPSLTDAERAFHNELKARDSDSREMERVVAGLETFISSRAELFRPRPSRADSAMLLEDSKLQLIQRHLDEQNEELAKLVGQLNNMQLQ